MFQAMFPGFIFFFSFTVNSDEILQNLFSDTTHFPLGNCASVNLSQKDSQIHESFCTFPSDGDLWRREQKALLQ